ncbi:hypothetical protein NIES2101_38150 [Calothrix sp. HK-06]|nr:hypothetical protein NIES2101_38150 [Calothrix sp. HK-06]
MPKNSQKAPASRMVRVSSPLIPYVQKLSDLHRTGHTEKILEGLTNLISNIENDIAASYIDSGVIADILRRLEALEAAANQNNQPPIELKQAPAKQSKSKSKQPTAPGRNSEKLEPEPPVETSIEPRVEEKTIPRLPKLFCPKCHSTDLKRWGHDKTGTRQRYKCSSCGKQFFK